MDSSELSLATEVPPISVEEWYHRFKIVKIVSKEPKIRGRWYCMDFNDPPATTPASNPAPTASQIPASLPIVDNNNMVTNKSDLQPLSTPPTTGSSAAGQETMNVSEGSNQDNQTVGETLIDHLMTDVREKVTVLKEIVNEHTTKIKQLEFENSILKAHASPEVLNLLQQSLKNVNFGE